jgi:hypothetical protein
MCIQKKKQEGKKEGRKKVNTDAILCHETEELERQRMKVT